MEPSEDHVKIETIKLSLNGLVVELKVDQARALWQQLDELFGPRPAAPVWIYPALPTYPPYQPTYYGDPPLDPYRPMCGGGGTFIGATVMVNPNCEPFPEKWVVSYDAYTGNKLEISI